MDRRFLDSLDQQVEQIREGGLYKKERVITSAQGASIRVRPGDLVLNFCANNYLGLSDHPAVVKAAHAALDRWGYGMSSVRFICGTQDIHKQLEDRLTRFLGTEDTILYGSCFDANGGLFETILGEEDAVMSDSLNHASIIDGIRLSKAKRLRYANNDMADLEKQLIAAKDSRFKLIATDGVFSMDGILADLRAICDLADKHDALVFVDDSHAVGFMGKNGKGSHEARNVLGRIDVLTGTLGKALGGASGGFTAGRREIVELLRQRSRPYLFSNSLPPSIVGASIAVLDLLDSDPAPRQRVMENARRFREGMTAAGFTIKAGIHPIVPIMIGDAKLAADMARAMLDEGIYVIGFSYPVVPKGEARIRVQLSAGHAPEHVDQAIAGFTKVGKSMGVID